jgi:signal transduction histidine kinase
MAQKISERSGFRLSSDLGVEVGGQRISASADFPFGVPEGRYEGKYTLQRFLELGRTPVKLMLARPVTDIQRITTLGVLVMSASTLFTTLLLIGLSVGISGGIARPIHRLSEAAVAVAEGDLGQSVDINHLQSVFMVGKDDEIGTLAVAFNEMVLELRSFYAELERKVEARTHALATAADMAQAVSSTLDFDVVMQMAVHLIRKQLAFSHLAIYTVESDSQVAQLREYIGDRETAPLERKISFADQPDTLVSSAVLSRTPQVVQDAMADQEYTESVWLPETRSAAAIPLLVRRSVIGVLVVQSRERDAFALETVSLLVTLGNQIAVGLKNAQLYSLEQQRRRLAEHLELAGRMLSSSLERSEVALRVLSLLYAMVPFERGALWIEDDGVLEPLALHGFSDAEQRRVHAVPASEKAAYLRIQEARSPLILNDVLEESSWRQISWLPLHHSWLGVPLIARDHVIGMIALTRPQAGAFVREEADLVNSFALQAGIALENAMLYAEIGSFNEHLEQMVEERTQELDKAYQTLEQLDRTKSDFIDVTAHELRTPLTVIRAYAQMLNAFLEHKSDTPVQQAVDGVLRGSERLYEIVNSMLDIAKLDADALQVVRAPVDLHELLTRVRDSLCAGARERSLSLTVSGLEGLMTIRADEALLEKVFFQVLSNAIKFTPDGGDIFVMGREGCYADGRDYVEILVQDTGVGIDPAYHEVIFEKFYQTGRVALHSSGRTKFKGGGPGLGLAIAQGLVRAHGGEIWVESEGYDEERCPGTNVYVRLPVDAGASQLVDKPLQLTSAGH